MHPHVLFLNFKVMPKIWCNIHTLPPLLWSTITTALAITSIWPNFFEWMTLPWNSLIFRFCNTRYYCECNNGRGKEMWADAKLCEGLVSSANMTSTVWTGRCVRQMAGNLKSPIFVIVTRWCLALYIHQIFQLHNDIDSFEFSDSSFFRLKNERRR